MKISQVDRTTPNASNSDIQEINTYGAEFEALLNYTPTKDIDKIYENISYEETKNMTDLQIKTKYSSLQEQEIHHIIYMRTTANNFSESEAANKAIFESTKNIRGERESLQFSIELFWTKLKNASASTELEYKGESKDNPSLTNTGSVVFSKLDSYDKMSEGIENGTIVMAEGKNIDRHRAGMYLNHKLSEEDTANYLEKKLEDVTEKYEKSKNKDERVNLRRNVVMFTKIWNDYIRELSITEENEAILNQYTKNNKPNILDEKKVDN